MSNDFKKTILIRYVLDIAKSTCTATHPGVRRCLNATIVVAATSFYSVSSLPRPNRSLCCSVGMAFFFHSFCRRKQRVAFANVLAY